MVDAQAQECGRVRTRSLLDADASVVTVVQLKDSSGFLNHCVAIAGGFVFDFNKVHALPLSPEALDACCLGDATYASVVKGFSLTRASPSC